MASIIFVEDDCLGPCVEIVSLITTSLVGNRYPVSIRFILGIDPGAVVDFSASIVLVDSSEVTLATVEACVAKI